MSMKLRKNLGRLATAFVATAMLASVAAVPASAAGNDATTTSFTKKLDMTEATGASVPALKYEYEIGTTGVSEVAATDNNPEIKVGIGRLTITDEVTFTSDDLDKAVTVTIPENTYTEPGIYRYKVTEKDNTADIAGMSEVNNDNEYYLDVYVVDNNGTMTVSSTVWTRTAITPTLQEIKDPDSQETTLNAVYGNGSTDKISEDVDKYTTYDLTVTKKTAGTMANAGGTYTFDIVIGNVDNGTTVTVGAATSAAAANNKIQINDQTIVAPGADGKSFTIQGIPADATYDVIENLAASAGYTVSAVVNDGKSSDLSFSEDDSGYKVSVSDLQEKDNTVVITNTRNAVSPTGIVMNVAPYALLVVVAAGACFVFLRKRRED